MLASNSRNGATKQLLAAQCFSVSLVAGLVNQGLASVTPERVRAGGKTIEVTKVRITEAEGGRWRIDSKCRHSGPSRVRGEGRARGRKCSIPLRPRKATCMMPKLAYCPDAFDSG